MEPKQERIVARPAPKKARNTAHWTGVDAEVTAGSAAMAARGRSVRAAMAVMRLRWREVFIKKGEKGERFRKKK
jgi:hypothetical protein